MSNGKTESTPLVITDIHEASLNLQSIMDEYSEAEFGSVTGVDYTFADIDGLTQFWGVSGGASGSALVLTDGTRKGRVQVDPRGLRIAKSKELGFTSKQVVVTTDFSAILSVLHEEGALNPKQCRGGIPRAAKGLEASMAGRKVGPKTNKNSQLVRFAPTDPMSAALCHAVARLDALREACHGLTMVNKDTGEELTISEYSKLLVAKIKAQSKKRSKASKKGKADKAAKEEGDSSNEVVLGGVAGADWDVGMGGLAGAFPAKVIEAFESVNGKPPVTAEEVLGFVSEACEYYAACAAEGNVIVAEAKAS